MRNHAGHAQGGGDLKSPAGQDQIEHSSAHVSLVSVNVEAVNERHETFVFQGLHYRASKPQQRDKLAEF